jgi:ribosomal subunit interface protein
MEVAMLRVFGRNLDIGDSLRGQVEERLRAALARYFSGGFDGHVTVGRDGGGFKTECTLRLDSGATLHSAGFAHNAHASFADAAEKLEKRLRRYKRKLKDHPQGNDRETVSASYRVIESPPEPADDEAEAVDFQPVVVAESSTPVHRLSVSAAVQELDLTGAPFLVFRHGGSGRVNVVYRRPDGHIGWIDPPMPEPSIAPGTR